MRLLCSTPAGITESITSSQDWLSPGAFKCSTPAGITESITDERVQTMVKDIDLQCSTPAGITESITSQDTDPSEDLERAQRLLASRNRSHTRRHHPARPGDVLNAC